MATTIQQPINAANHADKTEADATTEARHLSPWVQGIIVVAVCVVTMFLLTLALIVALTNVGTVPAIGFAVYCAAWLGLGFGAVFAGAIVFGRDH
jgi:hypothetical protein